MRSIWVRVSRCLAAAAVVTTAVFVPAPSFAEDAAADCAAAGEKGFTHVHASGMWSMGITADHSSGIDAKLSVAQERARLREQSKANRAAGSIVTHTEVGKAGHWKEGVVKDAGSCWKAFRKPNADEGVEWDGRLWAKQNAERHHLVIVSNRQITALVVRLKERVPEGASARQVIVIVSHLPAHVEGEWGKNTERVREHKQAMTRLKELVKNRHEIFPDATFIVAADWNLNHKSDFKKVINRHLEAPGYDIRPAWTSENTGSSLYGSGRLIDGDWYVNAKRCDAFVKNVAKRDAASDHRPYHVKYAFGSC